MDNKYTKLVGQWSFLIGMVLALATVFVNLGDWVTQVLIILGILTGLFHRILRDKIVTFGVIYLALAATAGSMGDLIAVGPFISDLAAAGVGFLGPVMLLTTMMWGGAYLIAGGESEKES